MTVDISMISYYNAQYEIVLREVSDETIYFKRIKAL